jgi:hypothetical protein
MRLIFQQKTRIYQQKLLIMEILIKIIQEIIHLIVHIVIFKAH